MKYRFLLYCFIPFALCANEMSNIHSQKISFDGDVVILSGDVSLEHSLGLLTAKTARLKKDPQANEFVFSRALLKEDVQILFNNNSRLSCDIARIDFNTLLGDLTSDGKQVCFEDEVISHGEKRPFSLRSQSINFKLMRKKPTSSLAFDIERLTAIGDVTILYDGKYRLFADRASYQPSSPFQELFKTSLPDGTLCLYQMNHPCHFESDSLQFTASSIIFDTQQNALRMLRVEGLFNTDGAPTHFSCNRLHYQMNQERLILEDSIAVCIKHLGSLHADDYVEIHKKKQSSTCAISQLKTKGHTTYRYLKHELQCFGQTHLNTLAETFSASSPSPAELCKQTIYTNEDFSVLADTVQMAYHEKTQTVKSIELKGHVLLIFERDQIPLQLAICDHLIYYPESHVVHMAATPLSKVLFWNRSESLDFSADELTMTVDPKTKEKSFRSFGDVRCFITEEEQQTVLKLFENRKWKKKNNPYSA